MHRPSAWSGALAILLLSLIASLRLFGDRLYEYPANPALSQLPEDAVVICLAGGKFRVEAAYSLYAQGVGRQLLIVGAGKRSSALGLAKAHAEEARQKIPEGRFQQIQVETESRNTIENAFAVTRFLTQNPGVKDIILITSSYHMRRAQLMIENQVHRSVSIIPYTPPNEAFGKDNWWHSWLGIQVTVVEYFKFLLASLLIPRLGYF